MKHNDYLPNQKDCIEKLSNVVVGAFFMEPGSGKTRPLVELVNSLDVDLVIYFAPYRTIHTENEHESIVCEVNKWGGFLVENYFYGIESISNSDRIYLEVYNKIGASKSTALVVDESIKIKNPNAKRTKRLLELSRISKFRYILNGTPLSRNLLDLYSQMQFLSPKILKMSYAQFKDSYCEYKEVTLAKGKVRRSFEYIKDYHNLTHLYSLIEPYVFESNLEIGIGIKHITIDYELDEDLHKKHKETIERVMEDQWLMAKPNFFLSLIQKLQNNYSRTEIKYKIVTDIIKDNPDVLLVAKFIETQEELKKRFPNTRVLSWQKNSFGLNLQYDYNKMILFDQHLDYMLYEQMIRRIYRNSQTKECIVWKLKGNVGLETLIEDNIDKKADLLKRFKLLSSQDKNEMVKSL